MASLLLPKAGGSRPPIVPPIRTGFDPRPDDGQDPVHKQIEDSLNLLLDRVDHAGDDSIGITIALLRQRRKWVEQELTALRMVDQPDMPAAIASCCPAEWLFDGDSDLAAFYQNLSNRIEAAIRQLRDRLPVPNPGGASSDG